MYVIENSVPLQGLLEQRYGGTSSIFSPSYPHEAVLRSMREQIRSRLRVTAGAKYWGEAEALMLEPLFACVAENAKDENLDRGLVTSQAYQLAAAYSLIANVCSVCEERKIAEIISMQNMMDNPLVKQVMRYMNIEKPEEGEEYRRELASGARKKKGDDTNDQFASANQIAKQIWGALMGCMANITTDPADAAISNKPNPISVLFKSMAMPPDVSVEVTAKGLFSNFATYLRQGKGLALNRSDRKRFMDYWAAFLTNIDKMIKTYSATKQVESCIFSQAYTAMYWALEYFKVVDDYEAVFPSASMRLMSSLWMKSIATRCVTMSKFFFKLTMAAPSFDVRIAQRSINETEQFFAPLIEKGQHQYTDFSAKWKETQEMLEHALEPFSSNAATQLYDELKAYVGVEHFLPGKYFDSMFDDIEKKYAKDEDTSSIVLKTVGVKATQRINMSHSVLLDRAGGLTETTALPGVLTVISDLSLQAQAVWDLIHFLDKAQDSLKIMVETAGDIWSALIPAPEWVNMFPLVGRIGDIRDADFSMHSPYQMLTDKYETPTAAILRAGTSKGVIEPTEFAQHWAWTKYLMTPINKVPAMHEAAKNRSALSRIVWPFHSDLPIGDPLTNGYMRNPIPALYTDTRSSLRVDNTIEGFLSIVAGNTPNASSARQYFEALAILLDRSMEPGSQAWDANANPYVLPIVNSLAAVMFVYVKRKNSIQWIEPSIPTIYGAPLAAFKEVNYSEKDESKSAKFSFFSIAAGRTAYYTVEATGRQYMFQLHKYYPVPGPYKSIAVPFSRSTYVTVPVLNDYWEKAGSAVKAALGTAHSGADGEIVNDLDAVNISFVAEAIRNDKTNPLTWVRNDALYPALLVMPHLLWDYDEAVDDIDDAFYKLTCLSIRTEWDEYLKTMRIAGFWNSPAILMDLKDYSHAMDSSDPSPLSTATISEPEDPEPETKEPDRADAQPLPEPEHIAPAFHKEGSTEPDNKQILQATGSVTNAPIMAKIDAEVPTVEYPKENFQTLGKVEVTVKDEPLAGAPANDDHAAPDNQDSVNDRPHYWKKLAQDGSIEDVVKNDSAPDGYVPATEEEFANFKKGKDKTDKPVDQSEAASSDNEA